MLVIPDSLSRFVIKAFALVVIYALVGCSSSQQMAGIGKCNHQGARLEEGDALSRESTAPPVVEFRGAKRDGHFHGTISPANWQQTEPTRLWKVNPGEGFSGMAVSGAAVYTLINNGYDEYLAAFNRQSGDVIWKQRLGRAIEDPLGGNGPRSTPTISENLVYALGSEGNLVALCRENGSVEWQKDLRKQLNGRVPEWGYCESLLVRGADLYVMPGGEKSHLSIALEKNSGAVRWQYGSGKAAYSSPLLFGEEQIVFLSADRLLSLEANTGKLLWEYPWETKGGINAAIPVLVEQNKLLVSSGYGQGAALIEVTQVGEQWQVKELWRKRDFQNQFSSSVYADGYLYGFHNSILKCVAIDDGRDMWRQRSYGKGTLIFVGDKLLVLSEKGVLALVEASPDRFAELTSFQALEGRCWTAPAFYSDKVFLRNNFEMVCIQLP